MSNQRHTVPAITTTRPLPIYGVWCADCRQMITTTDPERGHVCRAKDQPVLVRCSREKAEGRLQR